MTTTGRQARRLPAAMVAMAVLIAPMLAACSTSGDSATGSKGYISGIGTVTTVAPGDREDVPDISGDTLDGASFDVADHRGQVVVVNVWASWCPPCRAEVDDLVAAAESLDDTVFVGINVRDEAADAEAFVREQGQTYDSLYDDDGSLMLAFYGMLRPDSLPSTIVLDEQGRIAALVLGRVTASTLVGLVEDIQRGA